VVAGLPEEADFGDEMLFLPALVVPHEVRQEIPHEAGVWMDALHGPYCIGEPAAIAARLSPRGTEPVACIVSGIARIRQPADFVELVSGGTANRPIRSGPERPVNELCEAVPAFGDTVG